MGYNFRSFSALKVITLFGPQGRYLLAQQLISWQGRHLRPGYIQNRIMAGKHSYYKNISWSSESLKGVTGPMVEINTN
jgi:hypothetical protein